MMHSSLHHAERLKKQSVPDKQKASGKPKAFSNQGYIRP